MKTSFLTLAWLCYALLLPRNAGAQCQFLSPGVELHSVTTNCCGNCVVNLDLSFDIDINNGNKIIFIHIWRSEDYTSHTYSNQSQPTENGILGNALATIIIDNDVLNTNPAAPASQVFQSVYGPDPGIDDTIPPAIRQVKDAADGLTYNRTVVNASQNIYHYVIHNLILMVPGPCHNQIRFTADAWSSNSNSSNPPVQCSIPGITLLVNDPTVTSTFSCQPTGQSNIYSYTVSTTSVQHLSFRNDVYMDNGDGFFDTAQDVKIVADAGPYIITADTPFYSGSLTYAAPYSTTLPQKLNDLWIVTKNMTFTASNNLITTVNNNLLNRVVNTCSSIVLPLKLIEFTGSRAGADVQLKWIVVESQEIAGYTLQRKSRNGAWTDIAFVPAKHAGNTELTYTLTDRNTLPDISLYRLKTQSEDNRSEVSQNVLVPGMTSSFSYILAPNPSVDGNVKLLLNLPDNPATICLYNLQGRLMQTLRAGESGSYTFSGLQPATYLIKITGDQNSFTSWAKVLVLPQ